MSRVERHKNEYSKADRQAIENARQAEALNAAPAKEAEIPTTDVQSVPSQRTGRSAAYADAESVPAKRTGRSGSLDEVKGVPARKKGRDNSTADEDFGILDQTEEEKARSRKEARKMKDGKPEFKFGRFLGRIVGFIGSLILILSIVACLGLTIPRFAGIEQYVVISGSMEPAIPIGSMVYSAQTEPSTLEPGDVIVFYNHDSGEVPVTHRVVENKIADGEVITKGDANAANDLTPIPYSNIIGKKVLSVPMLGYLASPLATVMGKVAMGMVIVGAYLLTVIGAKMKKA